MSKTEETTFRDRPINIDDTGRRKWIQARQPKGKWYNRRTLFAWCCILFLVLAPIIKINGNPLMLLDIAHRNFSIFAVQFWAQDANILALIMLIVVVFIVLFTVIFGRLWCGWACPQTIFLEMVYRRIEYLIDGNHRNIRKEQSSKHNLLFRRILKHVIFLIVSVLITNIMLMWFVGTERLIEIITSPIRDHLLGFGVLMGISIFYYWIYAYFREQVCTMICPYGRMQGVLMDSKSLSVIYDYKRGEPRGSKTSGDCIDCSRCISVCPTGIDIKNGTQLECINCTACIDECNQVMKKLKKPAGLIRFDSVFGVENGIRSIINTRSIAYSFVSVILLVILGFTIAGRTPVETSLLRVPGTIYQEIGTDTLSNVYTLKVLNKSNKHKEIQFRLLSPEHGSIQMAANKISLPEDETYENILLIKLHRKSINSSSTKIIVGIFEEDNMLERVFINFVGPEK